jgi:uncharacterized protein YndB with AHSA1/START domain
MTAERRDSLDREIVLCRVIDAPRDRVFAAWTDPAQITQWFGPEGFTCETQDCDIRPGGSWRFTYTGPDGTKWPNHIDFLTIDPPRLIEMEHGTGAQDDPMRFHVAVTFDAQSNGKTVLTLRQLHPSAERRNTVINFGAVEYGYQTLDKLARHLGVN